MPATIGRDRARRTPATIRAAARNPLCPEATDMTLAGATETASTQISRREQVPMTAQANSASVPPTQTK
jgi:hypothetical protein